VTEFDAIVVDDGHNGLTHTAPRAEAGLSRDGGDRPDMELWPTPAADDALDDALDDVE
jgi:hypothetical protein